MYKLNREQLEQQEYVKKIHLITPLVFLKDKTSPFEIWFIFLPKSKQTKTDKRFFFLCIVSLET